MCQRNFIQLPDGVHFSPSCLCSAPLYRPGGFMRGDDISGQKLLWYFIPCVSKHGPDKEFFCWSVSYPTMQRFLRKFSPSVTLINGLDNQCATCWDWMKREMGEIEKEKHCIIPAQEFGFMSILHAQLLCDIFCIFYISHIDFLLLRLKIKLQVDLELEFAEV